MFGIVATGLFIMQISFFQVSHAIIANTQLDMRQPGPESLIDESPAVFRFFQFRGQFVPKGCFSEIMVLHELKTDPTAKFGPGSVIFKGLEGIFPFFRFIPQMMINILQLPAGSNVVFDPALAGMQEF